MTDKLTDEQRTKVANFCEPSGKWRTCSGGAVDDNGFVWNPKNKQRHKNVLTEKVAQLIEAVSDTDSAINDLMYKFLCAVSTNNTDALESLCWKLMPGGGE